MAPLDFSSIMGAMGSFPLSSAIAIIMLTMFSTDIMAAPTTNLQHKGIALIHCIYFAHSSLALLTPTAPRYWGATHSISPSGYWGATHSNRPSGYWGAAFVSNPNNREQPHWSTNNKSLIVCISFTKMIFQSPPFPPMSIYCWGLLCWGHCTESWCNTQQPTRKWLRGLQSLETENVLFHKIIQTLLILTL